MPLYFFNFSRAPELEPSPFKNEGLELADNDCAWEEATVACGEKLREIDGSLRQAMAGKWKLPTPAAKQFLRSDLRLNCRNRGPGQTLSGSGPRDVKFM